jgi:hypothetical protein
MTIVLHILFDLVVTAAVLAECVWVARKSRTLGAIVALGVGLRVASGLVLFAISSFDLAFLKGLHTGGGFWVLAIDAPTYYAFAADAASGLRHLSGTVPSPAYVVALGLWLRAAGLSVLAAILFNVVCYAVTVAAVVSGLDPADQRDPFDWPAIVLGAFSFSPVLLLTSTQTLKDPFFAMLSAIVCRAAFEIFQEVRRRPARRSLSLATTVGVAILSVGVIGALRVYYAAFLWFGFATGFIGLLVVSDGASLVGRARLALVGTAALALMWLAVMVGGGPYYRVYEGEVAKLGLATTVQLGRIGFERAGGDTNLSAPPAQNPQEAAWSRLQAEPMAHPVEEIVASGGPRHLATGLAAMFVPLSILKALSVVAFPGGRGLLLVADADTVFLDLTLLAIAWVIVRKRPAIVTEAPSVLFTLAVLGISTILLAYVVTNFGTLFRLRLLAAAPAWMAPLAFRSRGAVDRATSGSAGGGM